MTATNWAASLPTEATAYRYRPPLRDVVTGGADYLRPTVEVEDNYAKDVMHLVREVSRRTRRKGSQGILTARRETCLRQLLKFARYRKVRPTFKLIREQTPCCNDVISDTLRLAELLGLIEVIRHKRKGSPLMHPNSYAFMPVPSRLNPDACAEWIETKAKALAAAQKVQDEAILGMAWGMAACIIYARRVLAWLDRGHGIAAPELARASERRSESRRETKSEKYIISPDQKGIAPVKPASSKGWIDNPSLIAARQRYAERQAQEAAQKQGKMPRVGQVGGSHEKALTAIYGHRRQL